MCYNNLVWIFVCSFEYTNVITSEEESVMRIIGIDPGYAIVGYGVIDYIGGKFSI